MPNVPGKSGAFHDGYNEPGGEKSEGAYHHHPWDKHFTEFHLGSVKGQGKNGHRFAVDHVDRLRQKIKAFGGDL